MPLAMKDVEREGGGRNKKISWEGGGTGYQYLCTVEGEGGGGGISCVIFLRLRNILECLKVGTRRNIMTFLKLSPPPPPKYLNLVNAILKKKW